MILVPLYKVRFESVFISMFNWCNANAGVEGVDWLYLQVSNGIRDDLSQGALGYWYCIALKDIEAVTAFKLTFGL